MEGRLDQVQCKLQKQHCQYVISSIQQNCICGGLPQITLCIRNSGAHICKLTRNCMVNKSIVIFLISTIHHPPHVNIFNHVWLSYNILHYPIYVTESLFFPHTSIHTFFHTHYWYLQTLRVFLAAFFLWQQNCKDVVACICSNSDVCVCVFVPFQVSSAVHPTFWAMWAPRWRCAKEMVHWCTAAYLPTQPSCTNTAPLHAGRMRCASAASPR